MNKTQKKYYKIAHNELFLLYLADNVALEEINQKKHKDFDSFLTQKDATEIN